MNAVALWGELDRLGFEAVRLLLSVLWQSSVLLAAVALLACVLRRRRANVRHALWVAALLLAPLLPLMARAAAKVGTPQAQIPVMPTYTANQSVDWTRGLSPLPDLQGGGSAEAIPAPPASASVQEKGFSLSEYPWALALLGYCSGAGLLLSLVAVGRLRIAAWLRSGKAVTDPRVLDAFAGAGTRFRLRRTLTVLESEEVPAPMTVRTFRPAVLLPTGLAGTLTDAELKAVAVHELAHVKRNDPLVLALVSLARALLFFHPLVWLACRQISHLAEAACDDAVLDAEGEPVSYAKMLARLAEQLRGRAFSTELAAGIVLSKGAFLRRVEAILSDRRSQIRKLSRLALAATIAAGVLSIALAAALPLGDKGAEPADQPTSSASEELETVFGVPQEAHLQTESNGGKRPLSAAVAGVRQGGSGGGGTGDAYGVGFGAGAGTQAGGNEALAEKILTEEVMDDFNRRNEREGGKLVCAILRPPRYLVMLAMLGEEPEEPPTDLTIDEKEIQAQCQRLAERIIAAVKRDVAPKSWQNPNMHIEASEAHVLVFQTPEVVAEIRDYFEEAEEGAPDAWLQVNVEARFLECDGPLPEFVAEKLKGAARFAVTPRGAELPVALAGVRFALLEESGFREFFEATPRDKLEILSAPNITLFNDGVGYMCTSRDWAYTKRNFAYLLDGESRSRTAIDTAEDEIGFVCRPRVSNDGTRVWLRCRPSIVTLEGWETKQDAGGEVRVPILNTVSAEATFCIPDRRVLLWAGLISEKRSILWFIKPTVIDPERTESEMPVLKYYQSAVPYSKFVQRPDKDDWEDIIKKREQVLYPSRPSRAVELSPEEEAIYNKLEDTIDIDFDEESVPRAVQFIQEVTGLNILLFEADVRADAAPITLRLSTKLGDVLTQVCEPSGLAWKVEGRMIKVGNPERFRKYEMRICDLLLNLGEPVRSQEGSPEERLLERAEDLVTLIQLLVAPDTWASGGVIGVPEQYGGGAGLGGEGLGGQMGGLGGAGAGGAALGRAGGAGLWGERPGGAGGPAELLLAPRGRIYMRGGNPGDLLIVQTVEVHAEIEKLLHYLRAAASVQVQLEVEGFVLERGSIGGRPERFGQFGDKPDQTLLTSGIPGLAKREGLTPMMLDESAGGSVVRAVREASCWSKEVDVTHMNGFRSEIGGLKGVFIRPVVPEDRKYVFLEIELAGFDDGGMTVARADKGTLLLVGRGPQAAAFASAWAGEEAKGLDFEDCAIVLLITPRIIVQEEEEVSAF